MSTWLEPLFLGSAIANGAFASPGPTISYTSQAGSTLVLAGYIKATASGGLSTSSGLTSITDSTAGANTWIFSSKNSQFPPSVYLGNSNGYVVFIAWCINAQPVTSVTLTDSTGHADTWEVALGEWSNLAWPDYGIAALGYGTSGINMATVQCSTPQDMVVAVEANNGDIVATTSSPGIIGFSASLPGGFTHPAIGHQELTSIAPPGGVFVGETPLFSSGLTGALVMPMPNDVLPGDLLIFDIICSGTGTITGWPSGFTQAPFSPVTGANNAANLRYVATKTADGTEGSSVTATAAGGANVLCLMYALRGNAGSTPANTAVYTNSGYSTTMTSPSLTIANSTDLTIYGYGGCTSTETGNPGMTAPGGLSNWLTALNPSLGATMGIGWGTDAVAPSAAVANVSLDILNWAMDIPAQQLGVGGQLTWSWSLAGSPSAAIAMMSFGPSGAPQIAAPVFSNV
jgi:hypothetical protein